MKESANPKGSFQKQTELKIDDPIVSSLAQALVCQKRFHDDSNLRLQLEPLLFY
jgi:hypothetical protein